MTGKACSLVVCAVLPAGCGTAMIDSSKAEREIRTKVAEQLGGSDIRSVRCPDEVEAKAGRRFECTATGGDGTRAQIAVRATDDEGNVRFQAPLLHTGTAEKSIAAGIEEQTDVRARVSCPDLVEAKKGTKLSCRAEADDVVRDVAVEVADAQGNISWELE